MTEVFIEGKGEYMLSDKTLERLFVIEKTGSFAKAAEQLYISRSALVQQVKQLEEDLGFPVFYRDHRGVHSTEMGQIFLKEMQQLLRSYNSTVSRCRKMQNKQGECITIGAMPNLSSFMIPQLCVAFRQKYPDVRIRFQDYFPSAYFQKFRSGAFDISVEYASNYRFEDEDFTFLKLMEDRYCCMVSPTHPLARKDSVDFEDLRGEKLYMYRRGITKSGDQLRDYILKNEPEIELVDIDNYDSAMAATCELENAVMLYYSLYSHCVPSLVCVPTAWDIPIELGIGYHKSCRPIVRCFVEVAEELFCNLE